MNERDQDNKAAPRRRGYEHKLLLDAWEAADLLGLRVSRIRMAVFREEIPYRKIGGLVRFVPDELKDWIDSGAISRRPVSAQRKAR